MEELKLRRITEADLSMIESWLQKEYILKWFSDAEDWMHEVKNRDEEFRFITHFVVMCDDKPIGFCQYYSCAGVKEDWYGDTPVEGMYSLDYLIGEEDYLGKGLGKGIVKVLSEAVFALEDSKGIMLQPEEENKPSCNALSANGYSFNSEYRYYYKNK